MRSGVANADGERAARRLKEIFSVDVVEAALDGAEVYSEPVALGPGDVVPFDAVYAPDDSEPTQTF